MPPEVPTHVGSCTDPTAWPPLCKSSCYIRSAGALLAASNRNTSLRAFDAALPAWSQAVCIVLDL